MDKHTLKITARALREKLETIKDQNPDAMTMLNLLRDLLLKSENGEIHAPLEARDISWYRYLQETNLQDDHELRDAPINLSCSRGKLQFSRHLQRHWTKSDRKIMYGELFRPVLRVKREPHPYP